MAKSRAGVTSAVRRASFEVSIIAGLAVSADRSVSPAVSRPPSAAGARRLESAERGWRDDEADEVGAAEFKSLTPEEARRWRQRYPATSVWCVVAWQAVLTLLVSVLAAAGVAVTGGQRWSVVASVTYGGLCALLPSAAMAWGLTSSALARWLRAAFPGMARASLAGWLWWEGVKVLLVLAMLWSAPRWIPDLSWLGLVVGLVVVLKSYWLAWIVRPSARN